VKELFSVRFAADALALRSTMVNAHKLVSSLFEQIDG
jgi:hypothetical protein